MKTVLIYLICCIAAYIIIFTLIIRRNKVDKMREKEDKIYQDMIDNRLEDGF